MIGSLRGIILEKTSEFVLIESGGVGYVVYCSSPTLADLPANGGMTRIYTDLLVREDLLQLFGFTTLKQRELHRILTSVQGVGAKAALSIIGTLGGEGAIRAITLGDFDAIRSAHGIGPKIAQRVVHELREKITELVSWVDEEPVVSVDTEPADDESVKDQTVPVAKPRANSAAVAETHSALMNLGYQHGEAARAVAEVSGEHPESDTVDLIRLSLVKLASL